MGNIWHVTDNISNHSGGIRTVLQNLDAYLNSKNNFQSTIITNLKEPTDNYIEFKSSFVWGYNPEISKYFENSEINKIFHLHGVYAYIQYITSSYCVNNKKPYLLSPHGMLEPWIMNKNAIKKKIYLNLILNKVLKNAKVLHSITPLEKDNIYNLTKQKNIVEIPNLLKYSNLPEGINYQPTEDYLVFIGRLDKKKGLDLLIKAINLSKNKNIKLKIIGPENDYSKKLKQNCIQLGIHNRVSFLGSIFGNKKYEILSNAKALITPSYSEAIGMVNLEGAACKVPVITTFQTGIDAKWNQNGGILINPNEKELIIALEEVSNWNTRERISRGNMLDEFVYKNYSWEKKGYLWDELYNSILE